MSHSDTVGLGKTYGTLTAWNSARPATPTGGYIALLSNGQEFSVANGETFPINVSGTTSAANFIAITTDTGQSFRDHANKLTNALKYNQANGVGINNRSYGNNAIVAQCDYITVQYLQFLTGSGANTPLGSNSAYTHNLLDSCIVEVTNTAECSHWRGSLHVNCLMVANTTNTNSVVPSDYTSTITVNCTLVRPSDKTVGGSVDVVGGSPRLTNCAIFGFSSVVSGGSPTGSYNYTNLASVGFGTNNQTSLTYANEFVGTASTAMDFKVKAGGTLATVPGLTDTTDIPGSLDILGQARGTSWTVGCHQYVAAGGSTQNITITLGTLKFAGFPIGTNAKTMTAINQGTVKFAGFPEGINGKSMFAITQGTLVFAGRALGIAAGSALTIVLAPLKFAGFVLGVDAKTMTTMQRGLLTFAGFALTVSGTVTLAIPQATLVFAGRALNFAGTLALRMLSLLGVGL